MELTNAEQNYAIFCPRRYQHRLTSLVLPHTMKTLTNTNEPVNLKCKLGQGASYTII